MGKAQDLLGQLFNESSDPDKDKDTKKDDKDLVPINEPEDDFSDLNVDGGEGDSKKEKVDVKAELIKFFRENPNPKDEKVHDLADKLGIEHSELEGNIYALLTTYLAIGKHKDSKDDEFDPDQLKMGIEVEAEHTDDPAIAKEIAKDHLAEVSDYYTRLKKMEADSESSKKPKETEAEKAVEDENDV